MASFAREAAKAVEVFWNAYLADRKSQKFEKAAENISPNAVIIGTGADEITRNIGEAMDMFIHNLDDASNIEFQMMEDWREVQELRNDLCVVYGGFSAMQKSEERKRVLADVDIRYSIVCVKEGDGVKMIHMHHSVPNMFQASGEFYPKFLTERADEILQQQIIEKTRELEDLNEKYREQEEIYRVAISASDDVIFEIDVPNHKTTYDRDKIERIYDVCPKNLDERGLIDTVYELLHPEDRKRFSDIFIKKGDYRWFDSIVDPINTEYRIKNSKYGYMWIFNTVIPIRNNTGEVVKIISHIKNISEQKRREQELQVIAVRDGLTNLYNKTHTERLINDILGIPDTTGALFMIDLDNFKGINDTMGHLFADEVLKTFANILVSSFRSCDIAGRMGGDEFVVFMKCPCVHSIFEEKGKEIIRKFDEYIKTLRLTCDTSCSIGIATAPDDGEMFSELFRKADTAMYRAKTSGKHGVAFYGQ